jgi:hypothetical protein
MALAALTFGIPTTVPDAPASGKKLFLGADGQFFTVLANGSVESLRASPLAHTHDIFEVNGLQDALGNSLAGTTYSPTPPSDPTESMRWVDSTTLRAYEYVGGAWIEIVSS